MGADREGDMRTKTRMDGDDETRSRIDAHDCGTWGWGGDRVGNPNGTKEICSHCGRTATPVWFGDTALCWRCAFEKHETTCTKGHEK